MLADVRLFWHPQGDYLAVQVDRFTKTRKSTFTAFELFSVKERDIPMEVCTPFSCLYGCLSFHLLAKVSSLPPLLLHVGVMSAICYGSDQSFSARNGQLCGTIEDGCAPTHPLNHSFIPSFMLACSRELTLAPAELGTHHRSALWHGVCAGAGAAQQE